MFEDFVGNEAVTLQIDPKVEDALKLLGLEERVIQAIFQKSLRAVGGWVVREMANALTASGQGQPGGSAWEALKPKTAESKRIREASPLIGVDSGHMLRSLTPDTRGYDIDKAKLMMMAGSTMPYSLYFSKGTKRGMPARPLNPTSTHLLNWWAPAHAEIIDRRGE